MEWQAKKRLEIIAGRQHDVTLQKVISGLDSCNTILSTAVCGTCIAESNTFSVFEGCFGEFGGRTRLAMPKTICAPDTLSLKPSSGATEGVLD